MGICHWERAAARLPGHIARCQSIYLGGFARTGYSLLIDPAVNIAFNNYCCKQCFGRICCVCACLNSTVCIPTQLHSSAHISDSTLSRTAVSLLDTPSCCAFSVLQAPACTGECAAKNRALWRRNKASRCLTWISQSKQGSVLM